jgi:hypothetical protein
MLTIKLGSFLEFDLMTISRLYLRIGSGVLWVSLPERACYIDRIKA